MNIMQAAKHLGVSDKTIRRAIGAGKLKARYPSVNRAEIDVSDVEQWYATTPIRATPDETQARLAALERHMQVLSSEVQLLQQQITAMASTGRSAEQVSRQRKPVTSDAAPDGFTWLSDFADLHGMSRNEANRRWQMGMITGQKINTGKRRAPVAIAESGKRDF